LDESHKLDPWTQDQGPRPKSGKSRLKLYAIILERKSIGSHATKKDKKESSRFEEPRGKLGSKARSNSRIQFA
jgi:hypothetical protein